MKIRRLHLKNYKVFDDLFLDFTDENGETLNEVVLAGLNGTGKTTILEFLKDFSDGNIKNVSKDFELEMELEFVNSEVANSIYLNNSEWFDKNKCVFNNNNLSINVSKLSIIKQLSNLVIKEGLDPMSSATNAQIIYSQSFDKASNRIKNKRNNKVKKISFINDEDEMKKLILKPIKNKVFKNKNLPPKEVITNEINEINQVFKGIIRNSNFVDIDDDNLIFESANAKQIVFEDLSTGEKLLYFMGFMLKRLNVNNSIVMIDEPEDSLHPTWQSQVLKFYGNIGKNNQLILATHSPHVIGATKAECVFLLKAENEKINVYQPKYSKGHSIPYVLSEIMESSYRDTYVNGMTNEYLALISEGKHENTRGQELWQELEKLDANSEERKRIDLSIRRFKAVGK